MGKRTRKRLRDIDIIYIQQKDERGRPKDTAAHRMAKEIVTLLHEYDPFIYSTSADWHSIYIHFRNLPNGLQHKCRISDHPERSRYGYKWQIRTDGVKDGERKQWSFYFRSVTALVGKFQNYYSKVEIKEMADTPEENKQYFPVYSDPRTPEPEAWQRRKFPVDLPPDEDVGMQYPPEDNPYSPVVS